MNDDPSGNKLPSSLRRGRDLSELVDRSPRPTRSQRIRSWFTRGKIIVIGSVAALIAVVGLANSVLDLWDRTGGAESDQVDGIDIDFENDAEVWDNADSPCRDNFTGEPVELDRKLEHEPDMVSENGPVGIGGRISGKHLPFTFAHTGIVDPPDSANTGDWEKYEPIGAVRAGAKNVDIYVANRSDDPLLVSDIRLQIDREPAVAGTVFAEAGGDPVSSTVIGFNLDEEQPVALQCETNEPFFGSYRIEVAPRSVEAIVVDIGGGDCWCHVRVELEYWHQNDWDTAVFPAEENDPLTEPLRAS